MKKLLFTILLFISMGFAVQAQTKEETIIWLQQKLQKYIVPNGAEFLNVKATECFITITFNHSEYDNRGELSRFYKSEYYIIPTAGVEMGSYIKMKGDINSIRAKWLDNDEKFTSMMGFKITNGEENLYERLQKAVDHLATFCPKKQETF